ncbi:MAG: hypothetical protein R2736_21660 [Solirubrobacterales bacterium]
MSRTDVLHVAPGAIVPTARALLNWLMGCADAGGAASGRPSWPGR